MPFFNESVKAFTCFCGAACSEHEDHYWYSPAAMLDNGWRWIKRKKSASAATTQD
jgi:hypothetical protein